jgi:hypothetical protein
MWMIDAGRDGLPRDPGGVPPLSHPVWLTTPSMILPTVRLIRPPDPSVQGPGDRQRGRAMSQSSYDQPTRYEQPTGYDQPTGWTGWIAFAAIMLIIGGSLNLLYGIIAAVNDEWVVWTNRADVYLDLTEWGWVHIVLGSIVLLSGIGLFSGNILARTVAVIVAGVSMLVNFFFIPVYPVWALTVITIDILVIWAVTAHGREMREA